MHESTTLVVLLQDKLCSNSLSYVGGTHVSLELFGGILYLVWKRLVEDGLTWARIVVDLVSR